MEMKKMRIVSLTTDFLSLFSGMSKMGYTTIEGDIMSAIENNIVMNDFNLFKGNIEHYKKDNDIINNIDTIYKVIIIHRRKRFLDIMIREDMINYVVYYRVIMYGYFIYCCDIHLIDPSLYTYLFFKLSVRRIPVRLFSPLQFRYSKYNHTHLYYRDKFIDFIYHKLNTYVIFTLDDGTDTVIDNYGFCMFIHYMTLYNCGSGDKLERYIDSDPDNTWNK